MKNNITYTCLLCGRNKFTRKSPHLCHGGFRKRGLKWKATDHTESPLVIEIIKITKSWWEL